MDLVPIDGLIAAAAEAVRDLSQGNAQVQAQPGLRMVRYYANHGLIDPPAAWRGRTALYGPRHLLQLIAIKRLQAAGLSLVRIQELLLGADDQRLHELAAAGSAPAAPASQAQARTPVQPPQPIPAPPTASAPPAAAPAAPRPAAGAFWKPRPAPSRLDAQRILRIALPGGALLELPEGAVDAQLLSALEPALAPLRSLLEARLPGPAPGPAPAPAPAPATTPSPRSDP